MNKLALYRAAIITALFLLISGAVYMASNATKEPPKAASSVVPHDHDGDGKPDH
jgi:hypothetical protein